MPIDYSKYPDNWLTEIRPRILERAQHKCELNDCGNKNIFPYWSAKKNGKVVGWFEDEEHAKSIDPNAKMVRVVLTIAHLDHDEENKDVTDERLMAMCQLCHLRYDAPEKKRRRSEKKNQTQMFK